jgi:hypothetical protein
MPGGGERNLHHVLDATWLLFLRCLLLLLTLAVAVDVAWAQDAPASTGTAASAPVQPIPFSHRKHVEMKLPCNFCHSNPDHGVQMTLPPVAICMTCHTSVAIEKPAIQKLMSFATAGKRVPWVQVYGVPGFVFWSHAPHVQARVQCKDCHGDVEKMDVIYRATNVTTMGGCVECHKQRSGPTGCMSCHEVQSSRLLLEPLPASLARLVGTLTE